MARCIAGPVTQCTNSAQESEFQLAAVKLRESRLLTQLPPFRARRIDSGRANHLKRWPGLVSPPPSAGLRA